MAQTKDPSLPGLTHGVVGRRRLTYPKNISADRLTHYLFRYPAKFHAPVVRQLIRDYTEPGQLLYDPFCGSGTLLVEALVENRSAFGSDVDPVAVYVSNVKSTPMAERTLRRDLAILDRELVKIRRPDAAYEALQWEDMSASGFDREVKELWRPAIPDIEHWFRRYVIVDLARILAVIEAAPMGKQSRRFFKLVFASILRGVSNADPVPVSGLEVTSHMKQRDEDGRVVNPFAQWDVAAARAITDMASFKSVAKAGVRASALSGDATNAARIVSRRRTVNAVITSPPYHGAVDYYRRHQLEMYWLGLVHEHHERLQLLQQYIGRTKVAARHPLVAQSNVLPAREAEVEDQMRAISPPRADAFRHYCVAMSQTFVQLAKVLPTNAPALFVVGHSSWRGVDLNTTDLFAELSQPAFRLDEVLDYPVKNRYMSYARKNGASIDHEYVLVLRRTDQEPSL